jgi:two-component system phosphate regulon sensor histidine kinase PhoR
MRFLFTGGCMSEQGVTRWMDAVNAQSAAVQRIRAAMMPLAGFALVLALLCVADDLSPLLAGAALLAITAGLALVPGAAETRERTSSETAAARELPVRALLEALTEPAILLTERGTVLEANPPAREAFANLRAGDPISFSLRVPEILDAIRAVGAGEPGRLVEYADRVPVDRWIEARIGPVRLRTGEGGVPDNVLLVLHDLTHLRRAERMRVDFVANASHELRTPLAAILGFIETLQGPAKNDVEARARFLEIMRAQAGRMSRLIDDLLSLSRIEQKQHMRPVDPIDLVEVVRTVLDSLSPLAAERSVQLIPHMPPEPVTVPGDRDELIRVVENLVENGIKYGQSGGRVEVTVSQPAPGSKQEAQVVVRDFGPGIPAEHVPRLTERFYRIDVGKSRDKGGTGLGLAIVKHILARHRGRLVIESPGEGARFTVALETSMPRPMAKMLRRTGARVADE